MYPEPRPSPPRWRRLAIAGGCAAIFASGAVSGALAVKGNLIARLREAIAPPQLTERQAVDQSLATLLHGIDVMRLPLTDVSGTGGGIEELEDGRILYATGRGKFGLVDLNGKQHIAPFTIDMNEQGLRRHPVFEAPTFNFNWFRVTDLLATPLGGGRYRLLVGHHAYDDERRCVTLNLSRAEIMVKDDDVSLASAFSLVFTATPCITFFGPNWDNAFWGHLSGGRLLAMPDGAVLFTTGDHGYSGVGGYPAVAEDPAMTLGKVMRIDPGTGAATVYASGLRNSQGLGRDSEGRIWETEHGPRGGDEINLIREGGDYGWPFATLGTDYGPRPWPHSLRQGRHDGAALPPVFAFVPSIGVSNLIAYKGAEFPSWEGDLLVASLADSSLHRVRLDGERVQYVERIPLGGRDERRLRDIIELRDGRIALWTDETAVLILSNADRAAGANPYLDPRMTSRLTAVMSPEERAVSIAEGEAYGAASPAKMSAAALRGMQIHRAHCLSCHAVNGSGNVGPTHRGLVGRKVAGAADGRVWTATAAVAFAMDPRKDKPNAAMAPITLTPDEQRDLAAYIDALK